MKVEEKVGKSGGVGEKAPASSKKTRKKMATKTKWIILFSGFGVLIVGLVIAIVVILATRGSADTNQVSNATGGISDEEADAIYDEGINELMNSFTLDENTSFESIVAAIKEKMDTATDDKVRARYAIDYYSYLPILNQDVESMDEIIEALVEADSIVQTTHSASAVMTMANFYGNQDLYDRYANILHERAVEDDAKSMEDYEKGEYDESGNEEEGGVGVYVSTRIV